MSGKKISISFLIRCFISLVLSLWLVDVFVSFISYEGIIPDKDVVGSFGDYLGLFFAEVQIGLWLSAFCLVFSFVLRLFVKEDDFKAIYITLASSAVCAFMIFAYSVVVYHRSIIASLMFSLPIGIALYFFIYLYRSKSNLKSWNFGDIFLNIFFPALFVGLVNNGILSRRDLRSLFLTCCFILLLILEVLYMGRGSSSRHRIFLRYNLVILVFLLVIYSLVNSWCYGRNADRQKVAGGTKRPHVVLIVLDTVRADHLKRYGYYRDTMPFLEDWISDSLVAEHAVSPAGWTPPAHASILSGKTVSLHGVHQGLKSFVTKPRKDVVWLPELLSEEGYYCVGVTANQLALPKRDIGFDRVYAPHHREFKHACALIDSALPFFIHISERSQLCLPYLRADGIVSIVKRGVPEGDYPLFLFVNFLDAHYPYNPPSEALKSLGISSDYELFPRYYVKDEDYRRYIVSFPKNKKKTVNDLYDGELRWLDTQLRELLTWIDSYLGNDTIVIITSDHGEELGEDGRLGHRYGLSQTLLHVPLFVRAPFLEPGSLKEVVTIRRLFEFILLAGMGDKPSVNILNKHDEFGVIAERYPSGFFARWLGVGYNRPWVAVFDDGYKVVGPAEFGFQAYKLEGKSSFKARPISSETLNVKKIQERITTYWRANRDNRKTGKDVEPPAGKELRALKSLGYVR